MIIPVVLGIVPGCSLVGDERASDAPARLATTVPSGGSAGSDAQAAAPSRPTAPPQATPVTTAGPLTDAQLRFNPADYPPLFEPVLVKPLVFPRSSEFCASGLRMAQMAEQLMVSQQQDPIAVVGQLRAFFYQFGRTMALAPTELDAVSAVVKRAVLEGADRLNAVRTVEAFRVAIRELVAANPGLESAVNEMTTWCGEKKDISIMPRF